jgi:hypothetical protein
MAITITAKLDASGVKKGANEAADAVDGLGQAAASTSDQMANELLDTRNEIQKLTDQIEDLQSELDDMAASGVSDLSRVENAAEEAGDAVDSIGAGKSTAMEAVTAISTGYLALVDIAGKFVETGKKAVEVVNMLAAEGNPAAMELSESFGGVREQLLQLAESPIFQEVFQDFAELINTQVIPAIKAIPEAMFDSVSAVQLQIMGVKEFMGQVPKGTTEMMRQMHDMARVAYKTADELSAKNREERKAKAEVAKIDAELAKIQAEKDADATQAALDNIKTEEELRDVIESLTESIREQAKEGKLSDEEREKSLRKIAQAEERIKQIRTESTETEKQSAEESVKIAGDAAKERERIAKEESDAKDKLAKEALDQERRNIEERKRLVTGGDVKGAEQLLGAQSRQQVKEAYAQRKAEEAAGAFDASGASQKEVAAGRKRALAQARRQFDNGSADAGDIRDTQVELASKAAEAAVSQGKSSKETAQATKEAIAEIAKNANELEQVQAEMANMRQIMGGISRQGERRRAQVAGARQ